MTTSSRSFIRPLGNALTRPATTPTLSPESLADVTEALFGAFEAKLGLATVMHVVSSCRRDLDCVSAASLPELLDRLARQRLNDLTAGAELMDTQDQ